MPVCASLANFVSLNGSVGSKPGTAGAIGNYVLGQTSTDAAQTDFTQCQVIVFTGKEWAASKMLADAGPQDVDPSLAGSYFALAFVSTVTLWASAHGIGRFLSFWKRG